MSIIGQIIIDEKKKSVLFTEETHYKSDTSYIKFW